MKSPAEAWRGRRFRVHLFRARGFQFRWFRVRRFQVRPALFAALGAGLWLAAPRAAQATQGHVGVEGLYVHQLSHIFFIFSMGILIYWLRQRGLTNDPGWRQIGYSAVLFILWSADAFMVHLLDEHLLLVTTRRVGAWTMTVTAPPGHEWLAGLYYAMKLDHLLCVPALAMLYAGLRRLAERS